MAGLFELQLPSQSRSRRSQDVQESLHDTSSASSLQPETAAKEIVSQVVARRDATTAATASSGSIFSWKRRATGQDPSRRSSDTSPRNSADTSSRSNSESPERRRKYSDRLSPRGLTSPAFPPSSSSVRMSTSIDFTLTPSSPGPVVDASKDFPPDIRNHATSALAHAGLGIGLPPMAFPGQPSSIPSPPLSRANSTKRKTSGRPGTAHGNIAASVSTLSSSKAEQIRRVKSFTKSSGLKSVGPSTTKSSGNVSDSGGEVFVLTRDRPSQTAPHVQSMPEWSSRDLGVKGKEKAPASDATDTLPSSENLSEGPRGRQLINLPPLVLKDREQSASRRTSWWPGRRRVDSSPVTPQLPPPPIPQRSQARTTSSGHPTPSLPTVRPFSPLMGDEFPITESPPPSVTSFGAHEPSQQQGLEGTILGEAEAPTRRRHSLSNRTGKAHSHVTSISSPKSSRSPSQAHSQLHRYSWSMPTSPPEHNPSSVQPSPTPSTPLLTSPTDIPNHRSKPVESNAKSARRRSMTLNGPSVSLSKSPINESTPLLLRRLVSRPNTSVAPPDPFLPGWGAASGTRTSMDIPDGGASSVLPVEMQRTPSTSSGSTSSLSHSTPAVRSPRQRAGTTPPSRTLAASSTSTSLPPPSSSNRLLRRISSALFTSSSTPVASTLEISQPARSSTANLPSALHSGASVSSPAINDASSPRWSKENLHISDGSRPSTDVIKSAMMKVPIRIADETPEDYVRRLSEAVTKAEVAHVLAANGDAFHAQALRSYIDRFNFLDDPLDVALRKLLMNLGLPRETQQIDRVMEAFAARYERCNPRLFENDDHAYILAFSLIMLHTDAFNKSNKNKMTKTDYVKNARLPGVPSEILECFFDNVVFAPFIFIEDTVDSSASRSYFTEGGSRLSSISGPAINTSGTPGNSGGSNILGKANKIDPYYLITQGLLGPLRANVNSHIPRSNPFLFEGTDWPWDTRRLHLLFAVAQVIRVPADFSTVHSASLSTISTPMRRKSIALPSLGVGSTSPFIGSSPFSSDALPSPPRVSVSRGPGAGSIRITKVGVLVRKEDLLEGGKKSANRKWREWSVVLTGSQLLFFRDMNFASQLLTLPDMEDALITSPEMGLMNPDEAISLRECVALFDITYRKYDYTFRFLMPTGRQFLCQASDERSLNDWISTINYASAFKTAGVLMHGLDVSHKDVQMTGIAAAASHLQDLKTFSKTSAPTIGHTYDFPDATPKLEMSRSRPYPSSSSGRVGPGTKLLRSFSGAQSQVDLELPGLSHLEGAQQLKATFDEVKAELAATGPQRPNPTSRVRTLSVGARPTVTTPRRPATTSSSRSDDAHFSVSRNDIIRSCIDNWDSRIGRLQHELDSELRIARNLTILTPFQRATRDRIQLTIVQLAKKIKIMRIELTKFTCYRFVLLSDLADEERHLEQAKRDALKAATQRLSTEEGFRRQSMNYETTEGSSRPTWHLPPSPSAAESFYSTAEGSGNLSTPLSMLSENDSSNLPFLPEILADTSRDSTTTPSHSPSNPTLSDTISSHASHAGSGHERFYTAAETPEEIAEEWNETRAAKRVSLVKLPSNVELPSMFGRQSRSRGDGVGRPDNQPTAPSQRDRGT